MNKADLKLKWSKFTDTDKLVDDIMKLLKSCKWRYSEHGICTMLDEYFTNKSGLIEMLQKSDNYVGDMRIVKIHGFERERKANDVSYFCSNFSENVDAKKVILKTTDASGKTITDYLTTGVKRFCVSELEKESFVEKLNCFSNAISNFNCDGHTKESANNYEEFLNLLYRFRNICASTIDKSHVENIQNAVPYKKFKIAAGMKTSRAFNYVCNLYNVDTAEKYNKLFTYYADMMSGLKRQLKYVISVNPYDYLTMSLGNSWSSCHSIKTHGGWCGGTLSYMLDSTSIITFCVDKDDDVQTDLKIYRNMFHYGENILMQSRVYPQGNDGNTDLYKVFRELMQEEMATMLDIKENKWDVYTGSKVCQLATTSTGPHYKDYNMNRSCNISVPVEKRFTTSIDTGDLHVGHTGICVACGEVNNSSNGLNHYNCNNTY